MLARQLPRTSFVLLEGSTERASDLARALAELGLSERASVIAERAELAAHRSELRFAFDVVVARAFARPAVTAECGAGFLVLGGAIVTSEPPGEEEAGTRWPVEGLEKLGLVPAATAPSEFRFAAARAIAPLDARYPRRVGVPQKRPLF